MSRNYAITNFRVLVLIFLVLGFNVRLSCLEDSDEMETVAANQILPKNNKDAPASITFGRMVKTGNGRAVGRWKDKMCGFVPQKPGNGSCSDRKEKSAILGKFRLRVEDSKFCVDIPFNNPFRPSLHIYPCFDGFKHQTWIVESPPWAPDHSWVQFRSDSSGKCIDVDGGRKEDDTGVSPYHCEPLPHQLWKMIPDKSGMYYLQDYNSCKCLSTIGESVEKSTPLGIHECVSDGGHKGQKWLIEEVSDAIPEPMPTEPTESSEESDTSTTPTMPTTSEMEYPTKPPLTTTTTTVNPTKPPLTTTTKRSRPSRPSIQTSKLTYPTEALEPYPDTTYKTPVSGNPKCTREGIFPDATDCMKFYKCLKQDKFWYQYTYACPAGSFFEMEAKKCVVGFCHNGDSYRLLSVERQVSVDSYADKN